MVMAANSIRKRKEPAVRAAQLRRRGLDMAQVIFVVIALPSGIGYRGKFDIQDRVLRARAGTVSVLAGTWA